MSDRVTPDDIEQAAERIRNRVRRTPCLRSRFTLNPIHPNLMVKLECLQVTGSFKARGASNAVLRLDDAATKRGIITASGGNHGLAVAYAARASETTAVVYVPESTPAPKIERIRAWGAEVIVEGSVWDDANEAALSRSERDGLTYVHPFADPAVIAGQGTVGREMLRQSPGIDTVIVAVGGGGLMAGVASAVKAINPDIRVIAVEPFGAPTLKTSVHAGELVTLPRIDTAAKTLAPRRSAAINLDIITRTVDEFVLVTDEDMRDAAKWLWFEMGVGAELSGAASVAAVKSGKVNPPGDSFVAAVVCGAGVDGMV